MAHLSPHRPEERWHSPGESANAIFSTLPKRVQTVPHRRGVQSGPVRPTAVILPTPGSSAITSVETTATTAESGSFAITSAQTAQSTTESESFPNTSAQRIPTTPSVTTVRVVPACLTLYMACTPCTAATSHAAWDIDVSHRRCNEARPGMQDLPLGLPRIWPTPPSRRSHAHR
jgi:hypothetical protein